ncbi:MAG TPA: hypothetical protein DDX39_04925, partial [Bacteroidales bacterium]|nr:hypothetical protein [Bacteroidales bacterium]
LYVLSCTKASDITFFFDWNGNKEVSPFIFSDRKLYYLFDSLGGGPLFRNINSYKKYNYRYINLKDVINISNNK